MKVSFQGDTHPAPLHTPPESTPDSPVDAKVNTLTSSRVPSIKDLDLGWSLPV